MVKNFISWFLCDMYEILKLTYDGGRSARDGDK